MSVRILNDNKTIYQLYKDLVISGLVPADDFWSKYVDVSVDRISADGHRSMGI